MVGWVTLGVGVTCGLTGEAGKCIGGVGCGVDGVVEMVGCGIDGVVEMVGCG